MSNQQGLGRGLDAKLTAVGLAFLAAGAVGAYLGLFTHYGLRIGPVPIPLSIVGPAVGVVGLIVMIMSFRQEKCLACNQALDVHLAAFVPAAEPYVVAAVQALDAASLNMIPMGSHTEPNTQVSVYPCLRCKQIAKIEVCAFRPARQVLVPSQVVVGPGLAGLIDVVAARHAAHEARYEGATS